MSYYPRKRLTDLWKVGTATQDCVCSCCKEDIKKGTSGWIGHKKDVPGYYSFLCILCYDTWTSGDVRIGLCNIPRFRKYKAGKTNQ